MDVIKDLNMSVLMDYHWEFNLYMLILENASYQYWKSNLDLIVDFYLDTKQAL